MTHDDGLRYGVLTTNLSKIFNSILRGAKNILITSCIQMIFYRLVKYFNTRHVQTLRNVQKNPNNLFTLHVAIKIAKDQVKANQHRVTVFNLQRGIYEVLTRRASAGLQGGENFHTVTLAKKKYFCRKWSIYKYPCSHVLVVCQEIAVHFSGFVDDAYTITAYMNIWNGEFNPLPYEDYWMHTHVEKYIPKVNHQPVDG